MDTGSEYISPAEDWYRGQHRQQQERSHERHDELQFRDPIVSYSLSNERHRSILPHQQNYAHFYPQIPFPPTNQYSLSSFDSQELDGPVCQDQYQQHIQLPPPHSYVSHSHAHVQPSPYSSQRVFPDDASFSPSQYSPASSAANTPFLHHSSSQPVSQSFYHQQITRHEEIQQVQYREHPGDQDQRDYDASPPYPHQRSYDAQRQPLFGYDQEPTLAQGYFPLVDSEGYQSIADDSHCSSSPSPPIPDYIPICSSRATPNIISPIPHRHIYEDPSNNYHPSTPSPSPSPGPSTQHESAFHVAQAQVEDYPSPEDEDRFKTAPASRSLSPLTDLEDLVEEEVDAGDPAFEADPDEEKEEARFEASAVRSSRRHPPAVRTQAPRLPRSTAPSPEEGENVSPFIAKLAWILRHPTEYGGTIFWNRAGTQFTFSPASSHLVNHVLPTYLQHKSAAAFQRQLNVYGFSRLSRNATVSHLQEEKLPGPPRDSASNSYMSYSHPRLEFLRTSSDVRLAHLRPKPSRARKVKQEVKGLLVAAKAVEKAVKQAARESTVIDSKKAASPRR